MPFFIYTASDRTGALSKGEIEAKDKASVSRKLADDGLFVLEVNLAPQKKNTEQEKTPAPLAVKKPVSVSVARRPNGESKSKLDASKTEKKKKRLRWQAIQRALYFRQLHVMLAAGIPIHQATSILTQSDEYQPEIKSRLEEVPRDLERGRLLSKSLERSRLFGRLVISTIRLGEETGRLVHILENLANSEEQSVKLKRTLVSRLSYPMVVLTVMSLGLVVLGHVMSRVMSSMPNFKPADVPIFGALTQVFQHGAFLPLCFLGFSMLGFLLWKVWSNPNLKFAVEGFFLQVPVLGGLLTRLEANTVTTQLSLLLGAGLPIDRGLGLCSDLVWTEKFRRALLSTQSDLRSGSELGECFQASNLFPRDVLGLISAGETSGKLEESLSKAAAYCADQVDRTLETALALVEPLLIGFLGIAVGTVLLCTFVPVFNNLQNL